MPATWIEPEALEAEGALMRLWPMVSHASAPPWFRPWLEVEATGLAGGFAIAQAHGVFDTAYVESAGVMSRVTERPEDVRVLTYRYEAIRSDALPQRESLELIKETLQRWTS
jgi:hypothetical protein